MSIDRGHGIATSSVLADSYDLDGIIAKYEQFADTYLGHKAVEPTTDDDGDALIVGALYFNTVDNELRVYDGTTWKAVYTGSLKVDNFTGDGTTVTYTLSTAPNNENSTQVYIDGIYQQKDTYSLANAVLTFSQAPPTNAGIEVTIIDSFQIGVGDAENITYNQGGTGSVSRTVENKLQESVSVKDFGAVGDGVTDDTAAIQAALDTAKTVYFPGGIYWVSESAHQSLPNLGFSIKQAQEIIFLAGAEVLLETGSYSHIFTNDANTTEAKLINVVIDGNNSYANGFSILGIGGGSPAITLDNCIVKNIKSEIVISGEASVTQNQGGAGYVIELEGSATLIGCKAINCTFGIRYAPENSAACYANIDNFYAENCESILNTNPSNFDNRDYGYNSPTSPIGEGYCNLTNVTFKDCGKSTDGRINASFKWVEVSSGNYHPHAGQKRGVGTYNSGSWAIMPYNASDTEYSSSATYNTNDTVKVANDGKYSALFSFGRAGNVNISNVSGTNSGAYGSIGALIRGIIRNCNFDNFLVDVSCDYDILFGTSPSTSLYELQPFMTCENVIATKIKNSGTTERYMEANMPINGTWATAFGYVFTVDYAKNINNVSVDLHSKISQDLLGVELATSVSQSTVFVDTCMFGAYRKDTNHSVRGNLKAVINNGNSISISKELFDVDEVIANDIIATNLGLGTVTSPTESLHSDGNIKLSNLDANIIFTTGTIYGGTTYGDLRIATDRFRIYDETKATALYGFESSFVKPYPDNNASMGTSSNRWSVVYAATGTINTSDANEKQQIESLSDTENVVATALKGMIKKFKFNDAVEAKGDGARIHVGVIAQDVQQAFTDAGLNANEYAVFCSDTWWVDSEGETYDEAGEGRTEKTRLGIRYEELFAFIISAL